jgi:hypothetical protein
MPKFKYHTYGEFYDCFVYESGIYRIVFRKEKISIFTDTDTAFVMQDHVNSVSRLFTMPFHKDILNIFAEIEKLDSFDLAHIDKEPEIQDLGNIIAGINSNQYFENYHKAIPYFYSAKTFVAEILDFYSDNYE